MSSIDTPFELHSTSTAAGTKYARKKVAAIAAAAQVFAEKGFHGATTQDIATVMGIKQGSLYYYFKSKEQALQDVCEYGFENYVQQMEKICGKAQPFEAKMQMIITSHLTTYRQKNNAMKVHNDQRLYLPKERRQHLKELGTRYRQMLENTLQEGVQQRTIRADIDTHFVAYSIIGMCNSWGAYLVRDESLDLFDTIQQCADLVLRGVLN
ncbi:TetR/AcrR family transcriptional regulator [Arenicella chitinivorans]|nr:TetR/AcrR family transcriptional regulator [Arenicella chitinivorans]